MKVRPSAFAIRLLPLAILIIVTHCLLTAALQIGTFFYSFAILHNPHFVLCMRQVYVDERAAAHMPGRPCGGSADEPCPTLADAFGGSHLIKSSDYEVPQTLRYGTAQGSFSLSVLTGA
jgi:hypothetical protein